MKYVMIVPDGMADHPLEELNNRTPLEAARTPNMDFLAQQGMTGLIKTIPDNMPPGSDVGNLSLLGYNPAEYLTGRAPLEAASMGIKLADDEICFRCNLVTIIDNKMEDYSAGHIPTKEAGILIDALNKGMGEPNIRFVAGKSYRHLMIMKVRNLEDFINIKFVPPHDITGQDITKYLPQDINAPLVLKYLEKAKNIFKDHPVNKVRVDLQENPANMIWLWGQGTRPKIPSFKEKFGLKGAVISAVDLVTGIGTLAGLEVLKVPGITGYYDTDYKAKGEYAIEALKRKDFVFIHIEGPDEAGHNGDYKAKIQCIENIDKDIVGPILKHFEKEDFRMVVLPDHPTPVKLRTHSREPVGFVMYGKDIPHEGSVKFGESSARERGLKFNSGEEMMKYFIGTN